ncbi:hypothetical protein MNEG_1927 [Monoraphidium neglectum]|uniref:Uncharacterized protein n=1 Tax=Monoraphidium neglectum TaxID=145388 RepID=A0A0D2K6V4_9CHLO|nr:hypothetical protein MNEG_1927 [Monoraphidium neglectum]KIZ06033.1 hypothetical protein MNEG_1927 [Monoraphidium neglectum]|eukprot:XP_013905052.1 hypothetical protein MNEG_1927 [Monoraphidium neglectum]
MTIAVTDVFSCAYGQVCAVAAPGVLSNDDSATPGTVLTVVASTNVSTGSLELQANGSFVYTPATTFSGNATFNYTISNGYSLLTSSAPVVLVVSPATPVPGAEVNMRLVLIPSDNSTTTSAAAACPVDVTQLTTLAEGFAAKMRTSDGITDVQTTAVKCEYICTPSTLAAKKCIASGGAAGSYIVVRNPTTRAATVFFDGEVQGLADVGLNDTSSMDSSARKLLATAQPKAAVFQACCVSPKQREPPKGNAPTCKRINVGKTMTKLMRLSKCKCLNLREFVKAEIYPFTAGLAATVCVSKPSKRNPAKCANQVLNAGFATIACLAPATTNGSGILSLEFESARGFSVGRLGTVVATCTNSKFTSISSCNIANTNGTVVTNTPAGGVRLASAEWDAGCLCKATGRRPVVMVQAAQVVAGPSCSLT